VNAEATVRSAATEVKESALLLIVLGFGMVVLGVLAMGAPLMTGVAVGILVGVLIIAGGLAQAFYALKAKSWGSGTLGVLLGGLSILCGILMLGHPLFGLAFLTLVLAIYFIADGIFEIAFAFKLKPLTGWGWTLVSGIVSLFLGMVIWRQWPISGTWAVGLLVGINICFSGWSLIALGAAARRVARAVS
jgi:uncharacterized membrane protein HdeD (DUF308 family)